MDDSRRTVHSSDSSWLLLLTEGLEMAYQYEFIGGPRDGDVLEVESELDQWLVPVMLQADFTCHAEFAAKSPAPVDAHVYRADYLRRGTTYYRVLTWEGIR